MPADAQGQMYVMCLGQHTWCSVDGTETKRGLSLVVHNVSREGERSKVRLHGARAREEESIVIIAYTSKVYDSLDAYDIGILITLGI